MKYLLFLIGSVCCFCVQLQGQHAFIPPSPNAASLGIYGDIPVSKYTGVPNISIPIYEINMDGYSLPIQLSYHASGIRVQQEASWVGLGWYLLAGGVITKNVRGKDDFRGGYMFTEEIPENKDQALEVLKEYLEKKGDSYSLTHDLNPDIYYYNISGYSGKFLISKTGKGILFTPQENLKIEWKSSLHNQSGVWEITDPNGIKYYFDDYEETHTHISSDKSSFDIAATTAWYLSKIVLLNGQSIDFDYTNRQGPQFVESKSVEARNPVAGTSEGSCIGNAEYVFYEVCKTRAITQYERILKRITWPDGYIDFLLSTREDIEYLNQKIVSPSKLDEINIYTNGEMSTLIKKIGFSYSYFNENKVNDRNKYEYLRLRLDHLKISDQLYSFRYFLVDREEMPSKTTNGYDHWGYYNGQASTKLLPKYRDPKTGRVYDGADRESNEKAIIGSLSEIIYPTGGKSYFSYQLNEYLSNDYTNVKGGGIRIAKIETASTTRHFSYENQTFSTGKLLSDPIYAYEELYIGRCTNANVFRELVLTRLSASCQPLTGFQHGNSVGYDQVTEFITDGERRSTIEEYFYNEKEEQSEYPFAPNKINLSNGLLKSRVIYSDWKPVKKEFYKYGKEKLPSVYAYASFGSTWCHYENPFEWWRLISKTTEQDDVTTLCEYSYNDQYLLSQELIQTSSPKIIKRIYKYPSDIISGSDLLVMENMRNKHILTPCIETLDYVVENNSSKLISGEYKEYKLFHSNLYLPHIVKKLKISTPIENNSNYSQYYEPVITYDYNTNGYVTGFCVKGDLETAIIWGYNGMYPVVKAQNAGMKNVVIKREITDKMTIDTNEKKRITIKHAGGDVTIQ